MRVVHCKREPYDVYIGRGRCPVTGKLGEWGNPFSHLPGTLAEFQVATREEAIDSFEVWLPPELRARLGELRGRTLGCWCHPKACHGDVLLRLANH